jgi:uncharacterized protein
VPEPLEYRRPMFRAILSRLHEPRRFIQVLAGPRQVGKTTLALQVAAALRLPTHYASADEPTLRETGWLQAQWDIGRVRASGSRRGAVLILDEAQKVANWSETAKRMWDEDSRSHLQLKVILLGSSPLLIRRGLTESLAGRFEITRIPHWTFPEMRHAFGWSLEQFLVYGGYPGAAPLIADASRWTAYIRDSLIEPTISRDILLLTRIDKPALLRQLFQLSCDYSAQILSYTKMLGQLQDAGNTTTLAHYLELLAGAGVVVGLQKFSGSRVRQRGSSPKLLALNTALMTAMSGRSFSETREDRDYWGRLVESAVGAHLVNGLLGTEASVTYWREADREVDFVVHRGRAITAIEVTSGRRKDAQPGMDAFASLYKPVRRLLVGGQGVSLDEFLSGLPDHWIA